jgi:HEAT repeat protein
VRKLHLVFLGAAILLAVALLAGTYWWQAAADSRVISPAPELPGNAAPKVPKPVDAPLDSDAKLSDALAQAKSEDEHLQVLEDYLRASNAKSGAPALRSTMVAGQTPSVRLKAFGVARDLAKRENREALTAVLRVGIGNPYPEVRRESIRACRDNPHYELVADLMAVVQQGGPDRALAIQALAFTDDPEAQKLVLDTARSEELPRADRIQAIALLSRTGLDEAVSYLRELATSDDPELQRFAMESLATWQERKKGR